MGIPLVGCVPKMQSLFAGQDEQSQLGGICPESGGDSRGRGRAQALPEAWLALRELSATARSRGDRGFAAARAMAGLRFWLVSAAAGSLQAADVFTLPALPYEQPG